MIAGMHNAKSQRVDALLAFLTTTEQAVMSDDIILPQHSKAIALNKGKFAIVDEADFDWLNQWIWHVTDKGYASHTINNRPQSMHRLILGTPKGMMSDHIDCDRLNNRRSNLRICNASENNRNRPSRKGKLFKGVTWHKGSNRWQARIKFENKEYYLGIYNTKEEAAIAYNIMGREFFGDFFRPNPVEGELSLSKSEGEKS